MSKEMPNLQTVKINLSSIKILQHLMTANVGKVAKAHQYDFMSIPFGTRESTSSGMDQVVAKTKLKIPFIFLASRLQFLLLISSDQVAPNTDVFSLTAGDIRLLKKWALLLKSYKVHSLDTDILEACGIMGRFFLFDSLL